MILADWIALAVILVLALLGVVLGFGKGLKFFTGGIFGIVISVFVCYCIGGMVLQLSFVQQWLTDFAALWADKSGLFFDLLTKIHMEIIVYYVALFLVVQLARVIIVRIIKGIAESPFIVIRVINKTCGAALFVTMGFLLGLLVFQVVSWVGGTSAAEMAEALSGSALGLDRLFANNPLSGIAALIEKLG